MSEFICGKFIDNFIISSRSSRIGAKISEQKYHELLEGSERGVGLPDWTKDLITKFGYKGSLDSAIGEAILVRKPGLGYGKVSFEITERCNLQCRHCYLGDKSSARLSLAEKKAVINAVESSGAMWLQITGGEPLLDKDFSEVYEYAHSRGILITVSTNGTLLDRKDGQETLSCLKPYRVSVSVYGAASSSYESMTRVKGSYPRFVQGLQWLSEAGIRTRLNIITTKYNENEIGAMVAMAARFGFEYHVFTEITPALDGSCDPESLMSQSCGIISGNDTREPSAEYVECKAGRNFFNVNSAGQAFICKIAREKGVNLLSEGVSGLHRLKAIADELLARPAICEDCRLAKHCLTCAPTRRLYEKEGEVPSRICPTLVSPERT